MAIITKPTVMTKGFPALFTLDKDALAAVPSVAASAYYSDTTNWKKVVLNYVGDGIAQFHTVVFDATQTTPTGYFLASEKSVDVYNILSISIVDFDNGNFRVPNTELVTDDFKVDYLAGGANTSLFGMSGLYTQVMQLDASDSNKMLIAMNLQSGSTANNTSTYHMAVNTSGSFNNNYSQYILDAKIRTYTVSDDGSLIWVVGQFGLVFNGQALPPLTTGTGFGADQSRVLEIDTASGLITHKFDIPASTDSTGMTYGVATYCMLVDSTQMYFSGNNYLVCYNRSSGAKVWYKARNSFNYSLGGPKQNYAIVQSSSNIFCAATQYDTDIIGTGSVIKISKVDGTRDTTNFPTCPQLESRTAWAVSPDGTKAVMGYGSYGVTVLSGGTWTNYGIDIALMAVIADNSKFYTIGQVVNSHPEYGTGIPMLSFNWDGSFSQKIIDSTVTGLSYYGLTAGFAISGTTAYISKDGALSAYNMTSGTLDSSFAKVTYGYFWGRFQFISGYVFLENSDFAGNYPIGTKGSITDTSATFVYFDINAKSVIRSQVINNIYYGPTFFTTSLYPNKMIALASPAGYVLREYDLTQVGTMTPSENGWPQYTAGATYYSKMISGNYLYIYGSYGLTCSYGASTVSALHRINMATKTLDTTWLPDLSGIGSQGAPRITGVTDTYVYVSAGFNLFYRFKISDGTAEHLTVSALSLTDPYIYDQKYMVNSIGSGKIVLFTSSTGAGSSDGQRLLNGKSYIIYNESDLSVVTVSSLTVAPFMMEYNPFDNTISGVSSTTSQPKMTKINLDADTVNSSPALNEGNGNYQWNPVYMQPMAFTASNVYTSYSGVFNRRSYCGFVSFNPFPTAIA